MKSIIIATFFVFTASSASALDEHLGSSSEYHGSQLMEHDQGGQTGAPGPYHDHGDNTTDNFVTHGGPEHMATAMPHSHTGDMQPGHDHGDNTAQNFAPHEHN